MDHVYRAATGLVGWLYREAMQFFNQLDAQQWLMLLVAAVVLGFFCLRGFGSRSGY